MENTVQPTYPRHTVPGNVHGQVGHFGPHSWQLHQLLHSAWYVAPILLLQDGRRLLYVLHLVLENQGERQKRQVALQCREKRQIAQEKNKTIPQCALCVRPGAGVCRGVAEVFEFSLKMLKAD